MLEQCLGQCSGVGRHCQDQGCIAATVARIDPGAGRQQQFGQRHTMGIRCTSTTEQCQSRGAAGIRRIRICASRQQRLQAIRLCPVTDRGRQQGSVSPGSAQFRPCPKLQQRAHKPTTPLLGRHDQWRWPATCGARVGVGTAIDQLSGEPALDLRRETRARELQQRRVNKSSRRCCKLAPIPTRPDARPRDRRPRVPWPASARTSSAPP